MPDGVPEFRRCGTEDDKMSGHERNRVRTLLTQVLLMSFELL
jgi:hypothetical protein